MKDVDRARVRPDIKKGGKNYHKYVESGKKRRKDKTIPDRLKENVVINEDGCHEWTGAKAGAGYGYFTLRRPVKKNIYIHRAVYEYHYGKIGDGLQIMHKCDNPCCCNIDHLIAGTKSDNQKDMVNKGRHPVHMKKHEKEGVFVVLVDGAFPSYIAPWSGDPGKTTVLSHARKYDTRHGANISMGMAKRYYPHRSYSVIEVENE